MTEGKKRKDASDYSSAGLRAPVRFFEIREGHETHRWLREEREMRKKERGAEYASKRERGIITTITLPPWDRSREEEKGKQNEKEDGEEKKTKTWFGGREQGRKRGEGY